MPVDIIDLVKREITCRKMEPKSDLFNRMKENFLIPKAKLSESPELMSQDLDNVIENEHRSSIVN